MHNKVKHVGDKHALLRWKEDEASSLYNMAPLAFRQILNDGISYDFYISLYF